MSVRWRDESRAAWLTFLHDLKILTKFRRQTVSESAHMFFQRLRGPSIDESSATVISKSKSKYNSKSKL